MVFLLLVFKYLYFTLTLFNFISHYFISSFLILKFRLRALSEGGIEPQLLVSVPNKTRLNPEYLGRAYDEKTYVLAITIRPSDGDIKS